MNRRNHTAYDDCQTRNADARHQTLDGREAVFLAVNIVEGAADSYRNNRYDEDVDECE